MIKKLLSLDEDEEDNPRNSLLQQYGSRCEWLKDDKFLRDLEGDSVDTEILDEELRSLQEDEPKTCRGKTVKFLESNPFQIVLCVLVLVDAGVVIAEILLDLHAFRGQFTDAKGDLLQVLNFLKATYIDELNGYTGTDMQYILDKLKRKYHNNETQPKTRNRRQTAWHEYWGEDTIGNEEYSEKELFISRLIENMRLQGLDSDGTRRGGGRTFGSEQGVREQGLVKPSSKRDTNSLYSSLIMQYIGDLAHVDMSDGVALDYNQRYERDIKNGQERMSVETDHNDVINNDSLFDSTSTSPELVIGSDRYPSKMENQTSHTYTEYKSKNYTYAEKLMKIAHILHYCSIAILGIFVVQLIAKMYGMGLEFCKKKMEIFDGIIIMASFALDLIFLEGIVGVGEEAVALLIMFLLWRILRVINGILVTAKKRQEFRIKLQKRARRRAEKKIELIEEDKQLKEKEISALRDLCMSRGANDDEIASCKPRRRSIFQKMDTSAGLSSIAALSLGFSMSMSGGGSAMFNSPAVGGSQPILNNSRRDTVADIMTLPPRLRRQSLAGIPLNRERSPMKVTNKPASSMEKVTEEEESVEETSDAPINNNQLTPVKPESLKSGQSVSVIRRSIEGLASHNGLPTTSLLPPGCTTGKQVTFELEVETVKPTKSPRASRESLKSSRESLRGSKETLPQSSFMCNTRSPSSSPISGTSIMSNGPISLVSAQTNVIQRSSSDRTLHKTPSFDNHSLRSLPSEKISNHTSGNVSPAISNHSCHSAQGSLSNKSSNGRVSPMPTGSPCASEKRKAFLCGHELRTSKASSDGLPEVLSNCIENPASTRL